MALVTLPTCHPAATDRLAALQRWRSIAFGGDSFLTSVDVANTTIEILIGVNLRPYAWR